MKNSVNILSTKVLTKELSLAIKGAGSGLIQHDFIEVKSLELKKISHSTLMISSKNAVNNVDFTRKMVFCVGNKTRLAIENAGGVVTEVFENSLKMAQVVAGIEEPATFVCGVLRMKNVEQEFKNAGLELEIVEAYDTLLKPVKVSEDVDVAMFYSPSGVGSYFSENTLNGVAVCIGETTEAEAKKYTENTVVASTTTIESVVNKAIEVIKG